MVDSKTEPPQSFLARRSILGVSNAMAALMLICFLVPFAFRSARLGLRQTENSIKDWLPSEFRETTELSWFAKYFSGERFILATWPGCQSSDQRLQILMARLRAECVQRDTTNETPEFSRARQIGAELKLLAPADFQRNWGGRNEKWLTSEDGQHYFITPDGHLYRWSGGMDVVSGIGRALQKKFRPRPVEGQFIASFGGAKANQDSPFYTNPFLITAPLFQTVETGPSMSAKLREHLQPRDASSIEQRVIKAERLAAERLTGTLFGPAVPRDFAWTADAFEQSLTASEREKLPEDWRNVAEILIHRIVQNEYEGNLDQLRSAPSAEQAKHWHAVFDGLGVAPPPRQTAVLVTLTKIGEENLANVVGRGVLGEPRGRLLQLAEESGVNVPPPPSILPPPFDRWGRSSKVSDQTLHLGGPPVTNVAIDEEGSITLVRLLGYSVLVGILLAYLSLNSIKLTAMVFFVSGVSAAACLGSVWFGGDRLDAILLSMPPLIYTMAISCAIHVVNYYREEVEEQGEIGAIERSVKNAWKPCFLAALTTAIGTFSLYTSNLKPIRNFGLYSGIGVMISLILVFGFLPAALEVFRPKIRRLSTRGDKPMENGFWQRGGEWMSRNHRLAGAVSLLTLFLGFVGLTRLETSVELMGLFHPESQTLRDYGWLEENFGRLVPMELVLRVPPSMQREHEAAKHNANALNFLQRAEVVQSLQYVVDQAFGEGGANVVGNAMASTSFMPELPKTDASGIVRSRFNDRLLANREELKTSEYMRVEDSGPWEGSELWRLSLRVAALKKLDYGHFIDTLRKAVEPVLQAYRFREFILSACANRSSKPAHVAILGQSKPKPLRSTNLHNLVEETIFEGVLSELLTSSGLRVSWLDPSNGAMQGKGRDEQWGKALASMDCVVYLRDHVDYDESFLREHATHLIDARQASHRQSTAAVEQGVPVALGSGPLQVIYTGAVPVVYKAQRALLGSLVQSTFWAFVFIAAVMAWLLNPGRGVLRMLHPRNLWIGLVAGLIAMLPNIFPLVVVFGAMGFMGVPIDIGVMMTSCVALGVAVDDTIHFTTWFREGLSVGLSRQAATVMAYRRVGPSMMQTTLIGGLGMFVFALSTFAPTMRFGVMMLVMLMVALIGDLLCLPALLNGYWSKYFLPKEAATVEASVDQSLPSEHQGSSLAIQGPHFSARAQQESRDVVGRL